MKLIKFQFECIGVLVNSNLTAFTCIYLYSPTFTQKKSKKKLVEFAEKNISFANFTRLAWSID